MAPRRNTKISTKLHIFKSLSLEAANSPLTTHNRLHSPLFRLPGELRNDIYAYAFTEEFILVRPCISPRYQFRVEPSGYPKSTSRRYPLYHLLNRRTVCRQTYLETAGLIFQSNEFRFYHVNAVTHLMRDVPSVCRLQIEKIRLAFHDSSGEEFVCKLCDCEVRRFRGLKKVVVETGAWGVDEVTNRRTRRWTEMLFQTGRVGVEVHFECLHVGDEESDV